MKFEEILYAVDRQIATITLNRPDKLNAMTPKMEAEMAEAMSAAERDGGVRVIVLTGAGRGFCAGADMGLLDDLARGTSHASPSAPGRPPLRAGSGLPHSVREDFRKQYSYFPAIGKPVIAAIHGPAMGLGFIMTLYCDLRFASDKARFGTAFSRRGLIAEHGVSWLLPRLVGISNALDLLYSARIVDAAEALRMGLVNRVLPEEAFMQGVLDYATELATKVSPRSMRIMKQQVWNAQFQTLAESIDVANEEMYKSFETDDFREGVAHFLEKRAPAFTGD